MFFLVESLLYYEIFMNEWNASVSGICIKIIQDGWG